MQRAAPTPMPLPVVADHAGLRAAQAQFQHSERLRSRSRLLEQIGHLITTIANRIQDLAQHPDLTRIEVMRRYRDGCYSVGVAGALVAGILLLLRMSLQSFLPKAEFSLLLQTTLAFVFALATVLGMHVAFYDLKTREAAAPRSLGILAAVCIISGLVLFALTRTQVIGFSAASPEEMQAAEHFARLFGGLAFVIGGLGLDLAGGLLGAQGWSDLSLTVPLRRAYLEIDVLVSRRNDLLVELAELDSGFAGVGTSSDLEEDLNPVSGAGGGDL